MRVWRLEFDDGSGPYGGAVDEASQRSGKEFYKPPKHPGPHEDPLLAPVWGERFADWHRHYVFGFASVDQYKQWFDSARAREVFNELGLELNEYEVPEDKVLIGEMQVAFDRDVSQHIATYQPDEV